MNTSTQPPGPARIRHVGLDLYQSLTAIKSIQASSRDIELGYPFRTYFWVINGSPGRTICKPAERSSCKCHACPKSSIYAVEMFVAANDLSHSQRTFTGLLLSTGQSQVPDQNYISVSLVFVRKIGNSTLVLVIQFHGVMSWEALTSQSLSRSKDGVL